MSIFQVAQDAKLRKIVKDYRQVVSLHPMVSDMSTTPELEQMFWNSLTHDLHVIRRRSQNLADGEITPVQKAFRLLMDEKADGNAATALYIDEILGLGIVPDKDRTHTLATAIQTRDYVLHQSRRDEKASERNPYHEQPNSSFSTDRELPVNTAPFPNKRVKSSEDLFVSDDSEPLRMAGKSQINTEYRTRIPVKNQRPGPFEDPPAGREESDQLRRLFVTYQDAKRDFLVTPLNSLERTKSAKFLRDTTENYISYLACRDNDPDKSTTNANTDNELKEVQETLKELHATLEQATKVAEAGSGGKKRRFDEDWTNIPDGPAVTRPPSVINSLGSKDPIPRGQIAGKKLGRHVTTRPNIEIGSAFRPVASASRDRVMARPNEGIGSAFKPAADANREQYNRRRASRAEREPHGLVPASAGQGVRRVFSMPPARVVRRHSSHRCYADSLKLPPAFGDSYRPSYR